MKKIQEFHKVFDTACHTREVAETILEGWEHKESISPVYVIVDSKKIPETINLLDNDYPCYHSMSEATDHMLEEEMDLSL